MDLPLITVVTVVRNDVDNIEKTILSVLSQNYPAIEYIVIDGKSNDETVSVIKNYSGFSSKNKAKSFIEDMKIENVNPISFRWIKGYLKSYFSFLIQRISPSLYGRIACRSKKDRISVYTIQDGNKK
jgi:hypothetical protein